MATVPAGRTEHGEKRQARDTSSFIVKGGMMIGHRWAVRLSIFALIIGAPGCQRENAAEQSQAPQPSPSVVDQAVRQSVDVIQTPMDKARGVEGTLSDAASRTADRIQEGTQ
jgi:hypothetical protein